MEQKNDIEIKLLANRRFIYSNRKSNIVLAAEHLATAITVLYPDEYENYSKRVDFVNSHGKEWTEALYIPEYKKYTSEFDKTLFHFLLPSEVTTEGELKMQFIAYKPNGVATVPFEVIPITVQSGLLAFKKNARSNPDLLILSYTQSTEALFKAEQAKAKAIKAYEQSDVAIKVANQAVVNSDSALTKAGQAENVAVRANDKADGAVIDSRMATKTAKVAKSKAETAIATAKKAKADALSVVKRADSGEFKGDKGDKGDTGDAGKDGILFATDNLIGLYVDENGGFYAYTTDTANIDFRYDEQSGELYIVFH